MTGSSLTRSDMLYRIFLIVLLSSLATISPAQNPVWSNLKGTTGYYQNPTPPVRLRGCDNPTITSFTGPQFGTCPGDTVQLTVTGTLGDATQWELYTGGCGGTLVDSNTTGIFWVGPSDTTTYYVRGNGGCVTSQPCDTLTLVVHPEYAELWVVDWFCAGGDYLFPDGTFITNITANLTHTSNLQTQRGCDSIITIDISVIDMTTPTSLNGGTLNAFHPYANFQWVDCNNGFAPIPGATNATFIPTYSSSYAVVSSYFGCSDTSACTQVTVVNREDQLQAGYSLFPNPNQGEFAIVGELNNLQSVEMVDLQGKQVQLQVQATEPQKIHLQFEGSAHGLYFIRLKTPERMVVLPVSILQQ